ncbi:MAG: hypothetical protein ACRC6E_14060 [Fusobacteriaceae bacterium]
MSVLLNASKTGYVGWRHINSLNNQVQDDSVGLADVLSLFKEAIGCKKIRLKRIK